MTESIKVVSYNPSWPKMFEDESHLIKQALGSNCIEIHHIGSTSVPGLSAKPIIDMLPVVNNILTVDQASKAMEESGYEAKGENGILFRRFFIKRNSVNTHHVHVFEKNSPEIERHLNFRDWMKSHSDDRDAYAKLKILLADKFSNDRMSYILGKEDFINNIYRSIGYSGFRVVHALLPQEWKVTRQFRQQYFFDKVKMSDPYTWTFNHPDHIHFILYSGVDMAGYAHIQLWKNNRAALRIIVIDESHRKKGMGSHFLKIIEKWLKQKEIIKLQVQSSPEAFVFYIRHHYSEMPFNDPDQYESDPRDIEMGKNL
jgi:GrpB-like predicted nucleotidyltransferase (UPF0157 family)